MAWANICKVWARAAWPGRTCKVEQHTIEVDSGGWSVSPPGVAARVRTRTAAAGDGVSDVVEWLAHHRDDVQTCQACPEVLQITDPQSLWTV